jgi:hypothetical protein
LDSDIATQRIDRSNIRQLELEGQQNLETGESF